MPFLFLSPSTQDFNPYVTTGNEQYWMNRIADEMEPYLRASGVNFTRNNPAGSAAQSIRDSNAGQYDFHLALHSNAMPEASAGTARGVDIYYSPMSEAGLRMANIIVDNLRPIYPLPEKVRALSTVAGRARPPCWRNSAITTTSKMRRGSPAISSRLPPRWSNRSVNTSASPSSSPWCGRRARSF
mgnify:CR=1 FL=1